MNADEKTKIRQLRLEGNSYAQISAKLNISENTIKSFCQRNKIPAGSTASLPALKPELTDNTVCRQCGKTLNQNPKHKPKKYCSDSCRISWWHTHKEQMEKKSVYHFTCTYCGEPFESYGNRSRKYCSHACYIKDRFGEGQNTKARDGLEAGAV